MSELITLIAIFIAALFTGFIDSIVGAGGLISIPALIIAGLPPQMAIALDKFGLLGHGFTSIPKFHRAKKIVWKYVPILAVLSIIAGYIGTNLLFKIEDEIISKSVGVMILVILPLIFLKDNWGIKKIETSRLKKTIGYFLFLCAMILGASISAGTGPIIIYVIVTFFGLTFIQSNATSQLLWILLSIVSLIIFGINGYFNLTYGIIMLVGMAIGGYVGAHLAINKGNIWIKRIFAIFVIISAIKLLFF